MSIVMYYESHYVRVLDVYGHLWQTDNCCWPNWLRSSTKNGLVMNAPRWSRPKMAFLYLRRYERWWELNHLWLLKIRMPDVEKSLRQYSVGLKVLSLHKLTIQAFYLLFQVLLAQDTFVRNGSQMKFVALFHSWWLAQEFCGKKQRYYKMFWYWYHEVHPHRGVDPQ